MNGRSIGALFNVAKERIPGAIFVLAVFLGGYFLLDGAFFITVVFLWLAVALAELVLSSKICQSGLRNHLEKFEYCPPLVISLIFFAMLVCMVVTDYKLFALAICACFISDTAGYIVGMLLGRNNKVSYLRDISPKKSYAGFAGALFLPIPSITYLASVMGITTEYGFYRVCVFACTAGAVAAAGDLLGSAAKRHLCIKDSGQDLANIPILGTIERPLIHGHGGYYDRMDSVSAVIFVMWLIFKSKASP